MTWEVAKEAIDYILDREEEFREESVIWDFIGGEPFLEIDLIDKICDYLKTEMYRRNHHWFNGYRFSFSTNGINYHTDKVQRFIEKNHSAPEHWHHHRRHEAEARPEPHLEDAGDGARHSAEAGRRERIVR